MAEQIRTAAQGDNTNLCREHFNFKRAHSFSNTFMGTFCTLQLWPYKFGRRCQIGDKVLSKSYGYANYYLSGWEKRPFKWRVIKAYEFVNHPQLPQIRRLVFSLKGHEPEAVFNFSPEEVNEEHLTDHFARTSGLKVTNSRPTRRCTRPPTACASVVPLFAPASGGGRAWSFDRIDDVHCKDGTWPTQPDALDHETPLDEGDVAAWVGTLLRLGYRGNFTIERKNSGPQQREDLLRAVALLKSLVEKPVVRSVDDKHS